MAFKSIVYFCSLDDATGDCTINFSVVPIIVFSSSKSIGKLNNISRNVPKIYRYFVSISTRWKLLARCDNINSRTMYAMGHRICWLLRFRFTATTRGGLYVLIMCWVVVLTIPCKSYRYNSKTVRKVSITFYVRGYLNCLGVINVNEILLLFNYKLKQHSNTIDYFFWFLEWNVLFLKLHIFKFINVTV